MLLSLKSPVFIFIVFNIRYKAASEYNPRNFAASKWVNSFESVVDSHRLTKSKQPWELNNELIYSPKPVTAHEVTARRFSPKKSKPRRRNKIQGRSTDETKHAEKAAHKKRLGKKNTTKTFDDKRLLKEFRNVLMSTMEPEITYDEVSQRVMPKIIKLKKRRRRKMRKPKTENVNQNYDVPKKKKKKNIKRKKKKLVDGDNAKPVDIIVHIQMKE